MMILTTSKSALRFLAGTAVAIMFSLLVACGGNYYQVTDVDSGKSYFTRDLDRDDGHVEFTDKATGDKVSLDKFEVRTITSQQYSNAVRK